MHGRPRSYFLKSQWMQEYVLYLSPGAHLQRNPTLDYWYGETSGSMQAVPLKAGKAGRCFPGSDLT